MSKLDQQQRNWIRIYSAQQAETDACVGAYVAATLGETKEQRAARGIECKQCRYLHRSRISGQAFTSWTCRICKTEGTHSDTGVPRYCAECCKTHKLCATCGGARE
jgi:hypothetical protein